MTSSNPDPPADSHVRRRPTGPVVVGVIGAAAVVATVGWFATARVAFNRTLGIVSGDSLIDALRHEWFTAPLRTFGSVALVFGASAWWVRRRPFTAAGPLAVVLLMASAGCTAAAVAAWTDLAEPTDRYRAELMAFPLPPASTPGDIVAAHPDPSFGLRRTWDVVASDQEACAQLKQAMAAVVTEVASLQECWYAGTTPDLYVSAHVERGQNADTSQQTITVVVEPVDPRKS